MVGVTLIGRASLPVRHYLWPHRVPAALWRQRHLLAQLVRRSVAARYRGSALGVLWSLLLPLLMLAVYTFVFSVALPAKWGTGADDSKATFALTLFCGLIIYQIFAESVGAATQSVVSNVSYVKKVVFPLEILPAVSVGTALVNALISFAVLLAGIGLVEHRFPAAIVYLPLVLLPLVMLVLGLGWFLASISVYVRDAGHVVTVILQMLIFLTPIFYPITTFKQPALQMIMRANPLSTIVEDARAIFMRNTAPNWPWWAAITVLSAVLMQLGYAWFMKTRRGFADVL